MIAGCTLRSYNDLVDRNLFIELAHRFALRFFDAMRIDIEQGIWARPAAERLHVRNGDAKLHHVRCPSVARRVKMQTVITEVETLHRLLEIPREETWMIGMSIRLCEYEIHRIVVVWAFFRFLPLLLAPFGEHRSQFFWNGDAAEGTARLRLLR